MKRKEYCVLIFKNEPMKMTDILIDIYMGREREREVILVEDKEENAKGIRDIYKR